MATRDVFSEDELARLRGFPELGRSELIRHFTLTSADEGFLRKFRTRRNVLGDVPAAPAGAVGRLSQRLGIAMGELRGYGEWEQTLR